MVVTLIDGKAADHQGDGRQAAEEGRPSLLTAHPMRPFTQCVDFVVTPAPGGAGTLNIDLQRQLASIQHHDREAQWPVVVHHARQMHMHLAVCTLRA